MIVASKALCWGAKKDSSNAQRERGNSLGEPRRRVVRCSQRKRPSETTSGRSVRARREGGEEGSVAREREGERSTGPKEDEEEEEEEDLSFLAEEAWEEEEVALRFWFSLFCLPLPLPLALLLLLLLLLAFVLWVVTIFFVVFFALPPPAFLELGMASSYWCGHVFR